MKKQDLGKENSSHGSPKEVDSARPTRATILNSGKEPESSCSLETQYASFVKDSANSNPPQLPTTSSPCGCEIERTTDFTTSRQYGGYVPPAMPGSQDVKHTAKHERVVVCPICGRRIERGGSDLEVRSQGRREIR